MCACVWEEVESPGKSPYTINMQSSQSWLDVVENAGIYLVHSKQKWYLFWFQSLVTSKSDTSNHRC